MNLNFLNFAKRSPSAEPAAPAASPAPSAPADHRAPTNAAFGGAATPSPYEAKPADTTPAPAAPPVKRKIGLNALHVPHEVPNYLVREYRVRLADGRLTLPLASEAQLEGLRSEALIHSRLSEALMLCIKGDAKKDFQKQQQQIIEAVKAGEGDRVAAQNNWTVDDFAADRDARRLSLKGELHASVMRMLPVSKSVATRLGELAAVLAEEIDLDESKHQKAFGFPYQSSRLVEILRYVAEDPITALLPHGFVSNPRQSLEWAGITL